MTCLWLAVLNPCQEGLLLPENNGMDFAVFLVSLLKAEPTGAANKYTVHLSLACCPSLHAYTHKHVLPENSCLALGAAEKSPGAQGAGFHAGSALR